MSVMAGKWAAVLLGDRESSAYRNCGCGELRFPGLCDGIGRDPNQREGIRGDGNGLLL